MQSTFEPVARGIVRKLGSLAELTRVDIIFISADYARIITSDSDNKTAANLLGFLDIVKEWQASIQIRTTVGF